MGKTKEIQRGVRFPTQETETVAVPLTKRQLKRDGEEHERKKIFFISGYFFMREECVIHMEM